MILTPHMLAGAAIGSNISSLSAAFIAGFASHFILDIIPHIDYEIRGLKQKKMNKEWARDATKVIIDLFFGTALIISFSPVNEQILPLSALGALGAIIPDAITMLYILIPGKLTSAFYKLHYNLHLTRKSEIHTWIRIATQIGISIAAMAILAFT